MIVATTFAAADDATQTSRFIDLIANLDRAQPSTSEELRPFIGSSLQCTEKDPSGVVDCTAHRVDLGGVKVGDLSFISTAEHGAVLMLKDFSGPCVPVGALDQRFGRGVPINGCADAVCNELYYQRPKGMLFAGLGKNLDNNCAASITINTDNSARLRILAP
jgi:hypothetical protein